MTSHSLQQSGKKTAIVSFIGGLLIFLLYYITADNNFILAGLAYVLVIGLFNVIVLTLVIVRAVKDRQQKTGLLRTAGLMLSNIPVMLLLFWFGGILVNTMRVTIVNSTRQDITDVVLNGCEKKYIKAIKAGESKTVWISIGGECMIFMTYKQGRALRTEEVVGYLTRWGGGKTIHKVGTNSASGS